MTHRKRHNSRIKVQAAIEAMKIQLTIAQIARQHGDHPNQVRQWKKHVIEVVTRFVFLSILMNFSILPATAQKQQEQIVFVSEGEELDCIQLSSGAGGQVKKLTLQQKSFLASTPSLSFDGERVAYVWQIDRDRQWHYDIYIIDIRSGEQHQVTFVPSIDLHPSWAPDGSKIAFASDSEGVFNLYTIDANGQNRTRMTNSTGDDVQPDWSPDGSKIAFASDQASAVHQIYWLDVKTGHQQKLTQSDLYTGYPRWSPDGTRVAFHSAVVDKTPPVFREILQVRADGNGLKSLITDGEYNNNPTFSPNGKQIAFTSLRNDNVDIYIFDVDSLQVHRLTRDLSFDYQPSWSPDGNHLVFVSNRTGPLDIHRINADGGGIVNLTQSGVSEHMPAWSPRGDLISFVRRVDGTSEIHVMDGNGNRQIRLDNSPFSNEWPAWSPQGNKIAYVNYPEQDAKISRIYTIDTDGQNKQLLFEAFAGAIQKISWSPDGKKMLFVYHDSEVQEIRILDVITREVISIDFIVAGLENAAWAPFGRTIIFSAFPERPRPTVRYGIFLVDVAGNNSPEPLGDTFSPKWEFGKQRFSWSPDGQSILFSRGTGNLYVTGLNGGGAKLFLRNAHSPDWQTPRVWRSVTPKNKLQTTWGEVKELNEE